MKHSTKEIKFKDFIPIILVIIVLIVVLVNMIKTPKKEEPIDIAIKYKESYTIDGIVVSDISLETTQNDDSDNKVIIYAIVKNTTNDYISMRIIKCIAIDNNGKKTELKAFINSIEPGGIQPIEIYTNYDMQNVKEINFE